MIYLDNAATTFPKPPCVIRDLNDCIRKYCGNPGRSSHQMSLLAAEAVYNARETVANHFGTDSPECVVFTYNATYALNIAIKSFATKNCHVLISDFEHNSVVRPLEALRKSFDIEYTVFDTDGDIEANIRSCIRENTTGIVCSIKSNVFGYYLSLDLLSRIAKEYGLFLIIDASQCVGHCKINLFETPCDVLCAPGHKALFGIQGCGFAVFKDKVRRETLIEGGSGSESESLLMPMLLPEGYEAGTLSTPAIVSLDSGIRFVNSIGLKNIEEKLESLTNSLVDRLGVIKGIKVYSNTPGIVSFNYKDVPSSYMSSLLDREGICVRGGLHCAPMAHKKNHTENQGALRVSFSVMNSIKCVDTLYKSLREITSTI